MRLQHTSHDLSVAQQRLLTRMREIQFGRIEGLAVTNGDPVFQKGSIVVREIKFGASDSHNAVAQDRDFTLKSQVIEMFEYLRHMREGVVEVLEIKNGLPFRMSVKETIGG
ncbi:MAG: hypothetical protein HQL64_15705 [Magnetococcales bacterium]|nr:hypothetical protein [Magnetococcales bacterium]